MEELTRSQDSRFGGLYAVIAYVLFGLIPLYWGLIKTADSFETLAWRNISSFLILCVVVCCSKSMRAGISTLFHNKKWFWMVAAAGFVYFIRLGVYLWAVRQNMILETSFASYVGPLVQMPIGAFIFREKLSPATLIAFGLSVAALLYISISMGAFPMLAVAFGLTSAAYACLKKKVRVNTASTLFLELLVTLPICFAYLGFLLSRGELGMLNAPADRIFLWGGGAVALICCLFMSLGAKYASVTTYGFAQYIEPSLLFLFGIFLYHNPIETNRLISFIIIWIALIIYSASRLLDAHRRRKRLSLSGIVAQKGLFNDRT